MVLLIVLLSVIPGFTSTIEIIRRNNNDTRVISGNWVANNIDRSAKIRMLDERTSYFGGKMPFYDYNKFSVETPSTKKFTDQEIDFIISNKELKGNDGLRLIYYQDSFLRTGPNIYVYKVLK